MAEATDRSNDREAELDRKIAEIRRKNEELIKRKQEIDNDRAEAGKVEGGTVSLSSGGTSPSRDDHQRPSGNIRERLGKGPVPDAEGDSATANSPRSPQQRNNKSERSRDENWRQGREKTDKERFQRTNDGGGKWTREWDSGKSNSNAPQQLQKSQQRRSSEEGGKGRGTKGSPKSPAANQKSSRPANQQYDRSPRKTSIPEDPEDAKQSHPQRSITNRGDKITISFSNVEKSADQPAAAARKSVKSRLGPRVEPKEQKSPPPSANNKPKPEKPKQNQKRVEQDIKLHVLPLNAEPKVASAPKEPPTVADVPSKAITPPANEGDDDQWEDAEEDDASDNGGDSSAADKYEEVAENDMDLNEAATRKVRTDTFDRIQQEMIDKLTENVHAVEALMDDNEEDDIDALLAGTQPIFNRHLNREQPPAENKAAQSAGEADTPTPLD